MDEGQTMVNRPQHKQTYSKTPGELTIEYLQNVCCGDHLWNRNKMFLVILNLHVTPMHPAKFWFNLTYHSGADEIWRFSRWPPWGPSHRSDQNYFSNSESLCRSNASHQVWIQSALRFGRICLWRISRWPPWWLSWKISQFSSSMYSQWYLLSFILTRLTVPAQFFFFFFFFFFLRFSSLSTWRPSWILERNQFSNSKSPCHPNASYQVWAQADLPFGSGHGLKIFKMATVAAILDIETEWF